LEMSLVKNNNKGNITFLKPFLDEQANK
jgi:hypothetical protein